MIQVLASVLELLYLHYWCSNSIDRSTTANTNDGVDLYGILQNKHTKCFTTKRADTTKQYALMYEQADWHDEYKLFKPWIKQTKKKIRRIKHSGRISREQCKGLSGASRIKQIWCGDVPWQRKAEVWRLPAALGPSCWWPALWSAVCPPPRARRSEAWSCPSPARAGKHQANQLPEWLLWKKARGVESVKLLR